MIKLDSESLKKLNLRDGKNTVEFTVITKLQGKATVRHKVILTISFTFNQVSCSVYLWNYDAKVIISDIDGTITKSDVLGHAAAFLGKDWTHVGVAELFSNVERNGYKFLYLSSRGISYAGPTRGYLESVRQDRDYTLPEGPVFLSPASLMQSIRREV